MYHLYVKTHIITGLKYLGYTSKDPYKYRGSGVRWNDHLDKHGDNVKTIVLLTTDNKDDIKQYGLYYSGLWNIVESTEWANLTIENGDGGPTWTGKHHSDESKAKISVANTGRVFSKDHITKLSISQKNKTGSNNSFFGKHHSDESKAKMSKSLTGKIRSDDFKKNLSDRYKGIKRGPMSEEHKRKISESKKRKNEAMT